MKSILVVDDDSTTLKIIKEMLEQSGYNSHCFDDGAKALEAFPYLEGISLVLSDYFMPHMDGQTFYNKVRDIHKTIPFVFLTSNSDISTAIDLMRRGAHDFIMKPLQRETLLFRIEKNIEEEENKRIVERVEKEKQIRSMEEHSLVNWRGMYAAKDIKHTEQFMTLFTRTVNQSGAFIWLDLIKEGIIKVDENNYQIQGHLVDLIIQATEKYQNVYDQISFINQLSDFTLMRDHLTLGEAYNELEAFLQEEKDLFMTYERPVKLLKIASIERGEIQIDRVYLKKVFHELFVNAIKYSPSKSEIQIHWDVNERKGVSYLDVSVRNLPKGMNAEDLQGQPIIGIPYEYSEMVFDLFYTINKTPETIPEEVWTDGMGLYVCRQLLNRQNSWIEQRNGVDYTSGEAQAFIKFTVSIPIH